MKKNILIAPSILDADFSCLGKEVESICAAGADWIHLDVMDGHFVQNISFGPALISSLRNRTKNPFDCHLMISSPERYLEAFSDAGCDLITIHAEAVSDLSSSVALIQNLGKKAGVAINPDTCERVLEKVLDQIDLILLMAVNPGFGGQRFEPDVIEKIRRVKNIIGKRQILISVDGGVNVENAPALKAAGVDVLVSGSAIFRKKTSETLRKKIEELRQS